MNETIWKANKKRSLFLAYFNAYIMYSKTDGTDSRTAQHLGVVVRMYIVTAWVWHTRWQATNISKVLK